MSNLASLVFAFCCLLMIGHPCLVAQETESSRVLHTKSNYKVKLDLSAQKLRFYVDRLPDKCSFREALNLSPFGSGGYLPVSALLLKSKRVDQRVLAFIDLLTSTGSKITMGEVGLLKGIVSKLCNGNADGVAAAPYFYAALLVSESDTVVPESVKRSGLSLVKQFESTPLISKPVNFYSFSPGMLPHFKRRRLLQQPIFSDAVGGVNKELVGLLAATLTNDDALWKAYSSLMHLDQMLISTGRNCLYQLAINFRNKKPLSVTPLQASRLSFYVPRSPQAIIYNKVIHGSKLFHIRKEGNIFHMAPVGPRRTMGWFERKCNSLAWLDRVCSELFGSRVVYSSSYGKFLSNIKGAFLAGEIHAHNKDFSPPVFPSATLSVRVSVSPEFTVDPLTHFYFLRARCYAYLKIVIDAAASVYGPQSATQPGSLFKTFACLRKSVERMESLFLGAALVSARECGLPVQFHGYDSRFCESSVSVFKQYCLLHPRDKDITKRCVFMVPLVYDSSVRLYKSLLFAGWQKVETAASYTAPPKIIGVYDSSGNIQSDVAVVLNLVPSRRTAYRPVVVHVESSRLYNRQELMSIASRCKTLKQFRSALK